MTPPSPIRLVVVSNRVGSVTDTARAGGLAIALMDAMRQRDGVWFGWSANVSGSVLARAAVKKHGRINGEFSRSDWTPIRYLNQAFSRRALAGIYRASGVGRVKPGAAQ